MIGQLRPMNTPSFTIASRTSFPGRLVSTIKQLDSDGMKEYPFCASH